MPRTVQWDPPAVPFRLRNVEPLGVTDDVLRRALANGRISRLGHGVYIATHALPDDPAELVLRRAVAFQMRRPEAIASHTTAALAWELPLLHRQAAVAGPLRFTMQPQPQRRTISRPDYAIALRDLPAAHRAQHPIGLFLTTPARTAVDLAVGAPLPEALMALDAAARLALLQKVGAARLRASYQVPRLLEAARDPLVEAVAAASEPRTRRRLAEAVALADARRESALESLSYGHMVGARLPLPLLQVELGTPSGGFRADFLWPSARVIGEADGMAKLQCAEDVQAQHVREEYLRQELGYRFVRWTYEEAFRRPAAVMARIERRLGLG